MPADIPSLELAFTRQATLDTCLPLCAAYLAAKRYMEALVVCKKGMKLAPADDPRGRLMLCQIYIDQGKMPRAEAELQRLLKEFPGLAEAKQLMLDMAAAQQPPAPAPIPPPVAATPEAPAPAAAAPKSSPAAALPEGFSATPSPPPDTALPLGFSAAPLPSSASAAAGELLAGQELGSTQPSLPPGAAWQGLPTPPTTLPSPAADSAPPSAVVQPEAASPASPTSAAPQPADSPTPAPAPAVVAASPDLAAPKTAVAPTADAEVGAPAADAGASLYRPSHLGFPTGSANPVKTAGTGRLTLLGLVPLPLGSWKVTLAAALATIVAASAYLTWMRAKSTHDDAIAQSLAHLRTDLAVDTYDGYQRALEEGEAVLRVDGKHGLTLSAMSFAQAVLAIDHHQPGALAKAEALAQAARQVGAPLSEYQVAADALLHYGRGEMAAGLAAVGDVVARGAQHPLVLVEALRLARQQDPLGAAAQRYTKQLREAAGASRRGLWFLGWTALQAQRLDEAQAAFTAAEHDAPPHPLAQLGGLLTSLAQGGGLAGQKIDLRRALQAIQNLPETACSERVRSLSSLVKSELLRWQGERAAAEVVYRQAVEHAGGDLLLPLYRGQLALRSGSPATAARFFTDASTGAPEVAAYAQLRLEALLQARNLPAAEAALEPLVRAKRLSPDVLQLLQGELALARGQDALGEQLLAGIGAKAGKDLFGQAMLAQAQRAAQRGEADAVVARLDPLLASATDLDPLLRSQIQCSLGQAYLTQGKEAVATPQLMQGSQLDPLNPACRQGLCRLGGARNEACAAGKQLARYGRSD